MQVAKSDLTIPILSCGDYYCATRHLYNI